MAIDQHLPPACAFAISVLVERDMDPDAVPEEAVEAAQHHLVTCVRCLSSPPVISPPRKKKRPRRSFKSDASFEMYTPVPLERSRIATFIISYIRNFGNASAARGI